MPKRIDYTDEGRIRALLVGRRVVEVAGETLLLDDGTVLEVVANEGCGGCPNGRYELTELNDCPNMVMAVEFEHEDVSVGKYDDAHVYRVFVLAENRRIKLLEVAGDDGNGWYGSGYWINVTRKAT